ncbi:MAG: hypothetical protein ABJ327_09110, partial [Litoreibacter sp.]
NKKATVMYKKLISLSLLAFLLSHAASFAQTSVADDVVTQLQADGYTVTDVRKSWLGRIVVTANSDTNLREVVLNRTSGEILRDQVFDADQTADKRQARPPFSEENTPNPRTPDKQNNENRPSKADKGGRGRNN